MFVPDWLSDAVSFYAELLNLSDWKIGLSVERLLSGNENVIGNCSVQSVINSAHLCFRNDIEDDPSWHTVIIHELLHVKHGRIDDYLDDHVFTALPETLRDHVTSAYNDVVLEPYNHSLAEVLAPILYPLWREWADEDEDNANPDSDGTSDDGSDTGGDTPCGSANLSHNISQ